MDNKSVDRQAKLILNPGVQALELPEVTTLKLFNLAIERYKENRENYFYVVKPNNSILEIIDGQGENRDTILKTLNVSEFPGITKRDSCDNITSGRILTCGKIPI